MATNQKYDMAVIGGGPGGYPAAIRAAQRGKKVALIEGKELGGTCLNRGCIPSKALIAGAEVLLQVKDAATFGIHIPEFSFDYAALVARKDQIVTHLRKSLEGLIAANGIQVIRGYAEFISKNELKITGQDAGTLTADKIIIASGSEPRNMSAFPFDGKKILDSTDLLNLKVLPKKLVVVGGGVIGCEFASLFNLLGVEVTVIEMLASILPMEDPSVASALTKAFKQKGIVLETSAKVETIKTSSSGVTAYLEGGKTFEGDIALISVGRSMNLSGLGLDKVGVKLKNPSEIEVNDKMETSVPGIYAIGDVASKWWLAHVATHQGLVAADNATGKAAKMHYNAIPNVIFTVPEIATVGLPFEEAKKQGKNVVLGQFPFLALGKSQASHHTDGFAQVVVDETTGQIVGAQVVGYDASSLISEMAVAIQNELTVECIHETIHAHPTLPESWLEASLMASGMPVHLPPKKKRA